MGLRIPRVLRRAVGDPWLVGMLVTSVALRWGLVSRGGTLFIPDERYRYVRAYEALFALQKGDWKSLVTALTHPDHTLFATVALLPAALHLALARIFHLDLNQTVWIPAGWFALFSVLNIGLIYVLALCCGAATLQARLAAFFMACTATMFFYSRHLLPYDMAMAVALVSACLGAGRRVSGRVSVTCGMVAAMSGLIYFGDWLTMGAILVFHTARGRSGQRLSRFTRAGLGMATILVAFLGLMQLVTSGTFLSGASSFSSTIVQGTWEEGWSHPWQYLWVTDHGLTLVWLAAIAWLLTSRRGRLVSLPWLGAALTIYALIVLSSNGLHRFVTTGRFDREMVPFICLAAAGGLHSVSTRWRPTVIAMACIVVLVQTWWTFSLVFGLQFPLELRAELLKKYPDVRYEFTMEGVPPQGDLNARYVLVDMGVMYPLTSPKPPPAVCVLLSVPHPLQAFPPYQFEGYSPRERDMLQRIDISMRLVDTHP